MVMIFILDFYFFAIDEYFQFPSQSLPEKLNMKKSRKLCLFQHFCNKAENENFQYLIKGSTVCNYLIQNGFKYVSDSEA